MHELHTALISAKNIHVNELDSTLLAKSLSNNTEDYSLLKLETCEALTQENHHFWPELLFFFSVMGIFTHSYEPVTEKPTKKCRECNKTT